MNPTLLSAEALTCERDGRRLFAPLQLRVHEGDVLQVLGANGVGKSTLLRALAGMNPDYSGEIAWCGRALPEARAALASELLYLGHRNGLSAQLAPEENLAWSERLGRGGAALAAIDAALREVGLGSALGLPCGQLSAGQQRRVALARLLLTRARLWLLDEPGAALDSNGMALLERLLQEHRARGGGAVVATHASLDAASASLSLGRDAAS